MGELPRGFRICAESQLSQIHSNIHRTKHLGDFGAVAREFEVVVPGKVARVGFDGLTQKLRLQAITAGFTIMDRALVILETDEVAEVGHGVVFCTCEARVKQLLCSQKASPLSSEFPGSARRQRIAGFLWCESKALRRPFKP